MRSLFEVAQPLADDSIDARFERFMLEHPDVYEAFIEIALDLRRKGTRHYSADSIAHVVRWHRETSGKGADGFKINDHFTSRFARKAMAEFPELAGFFELRRTKAER